MYTNGHGSQAQPPEELHLKSLCLISFYFMWLENLHVLD